MKMLVDVKQLLLQRSKIIRWTGNFHKSIVASLDCPRGFAENGKPSLQNIDVAPGYLYYCFKTYKLQPKLGGG